MTGMTFVSSEVTLVVVLAGASIDAKTGIIPNCLTYPAFLLLVACAVLEDRVTAGLVGATATAVPLVFLHVATKGRGLGQGDIKLAACIGAGLGPQGGLAALYVAFVSGGVAAAILLGTRRSALGAHIPFGPFLALGALAAVCFGSWVRP